MSAAACPRRRIHLVAATLLALVAVRAFAAAGPVTFEKQVLTDEYVCDGVTVGDIDRDGKVDVVAGPYWFAGPDFKARHAFYPPKPFDRAESPTDSMFSYVHDFNGDGWPDVLVLGRVHLHAAYWYENPGKKGLSAGAMWKKHYAFERIKGESPPFLDVDGDGKPELVAHWDDRWGFIRPDRADPTKPWAFTPITAEGKYDQFYHGTGVGDVDGDGRPDLILSDGWWAQPPKGADAKEWPAHPFRLFAGRGGAQMFAYDVDGDGKNDVITALDAHGWGLAWFRQAAKDGQVTFERHDVMGDRSEEAKFGVAFTQPHALALADVDGDGLKDIVVGKRMWAHGPKGDIEPDAAPVVYWFQLVREAGKEPRFVPHLIDDHSGVGVQITAADVDGDGRTDILTASKLGVFLFHNKGPSAKADAAAPPGPATAARPKPRLIVLTDIGGDPDDTQSMVRLMAYSNEFDIDGLIASAAGTPGELKQDIVHPGMIRGVVSAYGQVRPNLLLHAKGYPPAEDLLARVKAGNPRRGVQNVGERHDTEGSDAITAAVDKPDPRPVWVVVWGGSTDLGQALWKIHHTRGDTGAAAFDGKLRVHAIGDQDGVGKSIQANYPDVFYIESHATPGVSFSGVYRGMYQNESGKQDLVKDKSTVTADWATAHITTGHGPLGDAYPLTATQTPTRGKGIKEGDTPSWFYVLSGPLGLSDPEQPAWGGWGGRFTKVEVPPNRYRGDGDGHWSGSDDPLLRQKWTVARWRPAFQNDFAARMDWCVKPYREANHNPVAGFRGDVSSAIVWLSAKPGERVRLDAAGTADPDGNVVGCRWWVYREAGSYKGLADVDAADARAATLAVPADAGGTVLHVILEVTDDGRPPLTAYRRVVVDVAGR